MEFIILIAILILLSFIIYYCYFIKNTMYIMSEKLRENNSLLTSVNVKIMNMTNDIENTHKIDSIENQRIHNIKVLNNTELYQSDNIYDDASVNEVNKIIASTLRDDKCEEHDKSKEDTNSGKGYTNSGKEDTNSNKDGSNDKEDTPSNKDANDDKEDMKDINEYSLAELKNMAQSKNISIYKKTQSGNKILSKKEIYELLNNTI
jgi:hypothetical protein